MLKASDFRKVYQHGIRISGPFFAAFCLPAEPAGRPGPRLGFTLPRAFGKAVSRNRAKRRIREALRLRLAEMEARWDIVVNPRRRVLACEPEELRREVDRLVSRCAKS